jgi:hypothetical protein
MKYLFNSSNDYVDNYRPALRHRLENYFTQLLFICYASKIVIYITFSDNLTRDNPPHWRIRYLQLGTFVQMDLKR